MEIRKPAWKRKMGWKLDVMALAVLPGHPGTGRELGWWCAALSKELT